MYRNNCCLNISLANHWTKTQINVCGFSFWKRGGVGCTSNYLIKFIIVGCFYSIISAINALLFYIMYIEGMNVALINLTKWSLKTNHKNSLNAWGSLWGSVWYWIPCCVLTYSCITLLQYTVFVFTNQKKCNFI